MDGVCSTCLSRDRRLTSISTQYLEQLFNLKLNWLQTHSNICWECRGAVYKCVRFRDTAISAHITLDNLLKCPQLPRDNIRSLSNLAIKHNSIHQDIHYKDSIKKEKKEDNPYPDYEFRDTKRDIQLDDLDDDDIISDALAHDEQPDTNPIEIKTEPKEHDELKENGVTSGDNFHVIQVSLQELQNLRAADCSSKQYAAAKHKCDTCITHFASAAELRRHKQERHSELAGPHTCGVCSQRFLREDLLADHCRAHYTCYTCKACGSSHTCEEDARAHARSSHAAGKARGKRVKKPAAVKKEKRTLECTICSIAFTTIKRLSYHNCTVHKPLKRCDKCGKKYANNDSLKKHMQAIHNGGLPKQECPVCHKQYAGQGSLATHMQIQHSQNMGYCAECDRHFKSAYYYRRHIRYNWRHRTEAVMKYECDECGKKFMSKKYVSNHIETVHVRRLNYKCAHCGKEYTSHASLGAHVRKHHSLKPKKITNPNVCEICGKSFKLKKCLSEHMNTHTGARPFVCSVCGDAFAYSSVLYTHNRLKHLHLKARGKAPQEVKTAVTVHTAPQGDASYSNAQFFRTFRR